MPTPLRIRFCMRKLSRSRFMLVLLASILGQHSLLYANQDSVNENSVNENSVNENSAERLATKLESNLEQVASVNQSGQRSQKKVTALHSQTQTMLEEYRATLRSIEDYQSNNQHLREMGAKQAERKASLSRQLETLADTETAIIPMLKTMIDDLAVSVAKDMPFLLEERQQRVDGLRAVLLDPGLSLSQKYRQVLDAYEIERDFGYTLESYQKEIVIEGDTRLAQVLRVGRVALYYQSVDGLAQGYWDRYANRWQPLDQYTQAIDQAIAMVQEQAEPSVLALPLQQWEVK